MQVEEAGRAKGLAQKESGIFKTKTKTQQEANEAAVSKGERVKTRGWWREPHRA